ncbi:MAG: serine/threonine protein kinase [Acidiferrobacteraceae bacterium]|nr:serine/threonine protein kinase [Acidiferrobacteraceae bacterium]|tara:strand:+ start:2070 stop:3062 length:993 start_codon:yes stop_codon:yes gene_type:complete
MNSNPILDYQRLSPDKIINAVEQEGYRCDGHLLALNSYENRVYRVGLEGDKSIIAKFYRPERWDDSAILEEHEFSNELVDSEIPVIAPMSDQYGDTLRYYQSYRFALFPNWGGRAPDLENLSHIERLGRCLGRIHAVGKAKLYHSRPTLTPEDFGVESYNFLLENDFIPDDLRVAYQSVSEHLMQLVSWCYERAGNTLALRLHGDCHAGNILWVNGGPHFVDLDDSRNGPAIQDLWMLLSGTKDDQERCFARLLKGYSQFCDFNPLEVHLIEALRTIRIMHYYAWIARRWTDPAFPKAYPWFNTQLCWEDHILNLREQISLMQELPLSLI